MLTVFTNRNGDILFTYPDVELHTSDAVKFKGKKDLVVKMIFNVESGFYEISLHEAEEIC